MAALGDAAGSIRFDAPKFSGQQGKGEYVLVINGSLVIRKAANGGSIGSTRWGKERSPIQMSLLRPRTRMARRFKRETWRHLCVYDRRLNIRGDQGLANKLHQTV